MNFNPRYHFVNLKSAGTKEQFIQETLEEIDAYLKKASTYGFKKVFTSMFSVPGTKEEIIAYFKDFTKIVHKYGMIVSGDCNSELFHRLEATETDFRFLKILG